MLILSLLFLSPFVSGGAPHLWKWSPPSKVGGTAKISYPPQTISAKGVERLKIVGVKGRLRLTSTNKKTYKIKVTHSKGKQSEDWSLSLDRQGPVLALEVFNVALGAQWRNLVREEAWPEFDLEIEGPSVPAVISWREGDLRLARWQSDIEAAFLKGQFRSDHMKGQLKLQAVEAQIQIRSFQGELSLKGENGRVELNDVNGTVDINWLRGNLSAHRIAGKIHLEWPSGSASLKQLNGTLKANGSSTNWQISALAPSELEVSSQSGTVDLKWRGGAKVFLSTSGGTFKVAKGWTVENRDKGTVVETTIGNSPRGSIFVRTQEGNISWQ